MNWRHDLDPDAMTDEERRAKKRYDAFFVFETMEVKDSDEWKHIKSNGDNSNYGENSS